jgi:hypothetical protein
MIVLSGAGGRVLRWRLETYGLYMPSYPHQRPWWAINPRVAATLARRLGRYGRWLDEMDAVRRAGPAGSWQCRLSPSQASRWHAWLASHNGEETDEVASG